MKYNLRAIMSTAWRIFRKLSVKVGISFSEALHRAWLSAKAYPINDKRIADAQRTAGVLEEVKTWHGWKDAGFEVIHGSKAFFSVDLLWGSHGDGTTYRASFFGASQVQAI